MHRINPNKLLLSKWTAVQPLRRQKHFLVTSLVRDEQEVVVACELEAIIDKQVYTIDWRALQDAAQWQMGWH